MTDVYDQESDQPPPPRRPARNSRVEINVGILAAGAAAVLIAGIAAGWAIRGTPKPPTATSPCTEPLATGEKYMRAAQLAGAGTEEEQRNRRLVFQVVVQNPTCFSAELRASAQEALNRQ